MKRTTFNMSAVAVLTFVFALNVSVAPKTSSAADPNLDAVLGLNHPDCCHVIDLLMHNRFRQSMGHGITSIPGMPMPYPVAGPQPGDLELLEVNLVTDGSGTQGPVYQVSFRNTNRFPAHNLQISIVGVLCQIEPTSPCTMVTVPCINAGETKCIEIQLPLTALAMGPNGAQPLPFDTLIIALDSFDELIECNELNNVAILKRAEIGLLVVETPTTPTTVEPGTTAPAEVTPGEETVPVPAPRDKAIPSPLDKIDLDELDLGDAEESALRIALETM
jgi:hypothetical protein